ncbi:MAG TPA: hypothetical protein VFV07_12050 [Rhizomicrobium sp.]|nr:hypothetical protein [Rhizomicrobium sp.]
MQADNLTGIWHGLYTYPVARARVLFDATLIESGAWLTGSTHEIAASGPAKGQTIYATLDGQRAGQRVTFTKTYDGTAPGYGVVQYEGTLSADASEIEGRWSIRGSWSGKFLMIRSTGKTQAVEHHTFERI